MFNDIFGKMYYKVVKINKILSNNRFKSAYMLLSHWVTYSKNNDLYRYIKLLQFSTYSITLLKTTAITRRCICIDITAQIFEVISNTYILAYVQIKIYCRKLQYTYHLHLVSPHYQ